MSIIICVVVRNRQLFIASDRRAIRNGQVSDDFEKVHKIGQDVFFGMTGIAEIGEEVLRQLQTIEHPSSLDLIHRATELVVPSQQKLTIMLAGKDEAGNFFVWQKNNDQDVCNSCINENNIAYSISGGDAVDDRVRPFLLNLLPQVSVPQALSDTIRFASTIDPTISPTSTLHWL